MLDEVGKKWMIYKLFFMNIKERLRSNPETVSNPNNSSYKGNITNPLPTVYLRFELL